MKIAFISIQNFRSIAHAEVNCGKVNMFIGPNNCGKTNLFEAVEWFYTGKGDLGEISFLRDPGNAVEVRVGFNNVQNGITKMKNESNRTKVKNLVGDADEVVLLRRGSDVKKRLFVIDGVEKAPGTGFDSALNDFLPSFEYVSTKQYYDSVVKYDKKAPIGAMLSDVLAAILETSDQYKDFLHTFDRLFDDESSDIKIKFDELGSSVQVHLKKQFPDTVEVRFEVPPPVFEDLLKKFNTTIDDGVVTTAEEKGDGMQRALMLAIIQAYADWRKSQEDVGKSFAFFIDEAELHLHPLAQRKLKIVLETLGDDVDQVFINTHSSVFVADDREGQCIFKVDKVDGCTEIEPVTAAMKPTVVYELLGGTPADLLLPDNFLIVEGNSEVDLITSLLDRFYFGAPKIQVIAANGDTDQAERTINAIEKVYSPLHYSIYGNRLVVLCDKPSDVRLGGVTDFLQRHETLQREGRIFFLGKPSLEECYPDRNGWRLTHEEQQKASSKRKRKLAKNVGTEVTLEDLQTDMKPIIDAIEKCIEKGKWS